MTPNSPYIDVRPNRSGQQRAFMTGSRIRVQDIYIEAEIHGLTPDQIVDAYPSLTLAQVHAALAYYFDHQDAIQAEIRQDRELINEARMTMK